MKHPDPRDVGILSEVVGEEVDLIAELTRLAEHRTEVFRELRSDGVDEVFALPKVLVGGAPVEAGPLRDRHDCQRVESVLGHELLRGSKQARSAGLGIASLGSLAHLGSHDRPPN